MHLSQPTVWSRNVHCHLSYHSLPVPHIPHNSAKSDAAIVGNAMGFAGRHVGVIVQLVVMAMETTSNYTLMIIWVPLL